MFGMCLRACVTVLLLGCTTREQPVPYSLNEAEIASTARSQSQRLRSLRASRSLMGSYMSVAGWFRLTALMVTLRNTHF
jgi:hypothetical protein